MWLGHQTLQMTMRYAHLATNDLDSCVVVLETRPTEAAGGANLSPLESVAAKPRKQRAKKNPASAKAEDKKRA